MARGVADSRTPPWRLALGLTRAWAWRGGGAVEALGRRRVLLRTSHQRTDDCGDRPTLGQLRDPELQTEGREDSGEGGGTGLEVAPQTQPDESDPE